MILRQYLHRDPVAASYLFGCGGEAMGAVVDPVGKIEPYLRDAAALGLPIHYVIDTHVHADHVSPGRRLADAAEADYVLFAGAEARFDFRGVEDGAELALGNVSVRVLHTPGHTPEHISLLVTDRARGPDPWFVLTGHTLMVGDMGRTELASSAERGARDLFRSAEVLRALSDHLEVLPGAFSGSVCGRGLSGKASSTIGFERRFNRAFSLEDEEEFVRMMLREIPPPPESAGEMRAENFVLAPASEASEPVGSAEAHVTAASGAAAAHVSEVQPVPPGPAVRLGLRTNRHQFWLLVLVNAFVGAMVGLERTVLPLLADVEFGLASKSAALSFIATFGAVKAATNFLAGWLGDRYGRKRVLVIGWLFALPVPLLVMWAPSWSWIVVANVLLGINQGLTWSTTVTMKIDLVGPKQRGLAMGLNEFAGYLAVALTALATGYIAEAYSLRPEPFYLGIAFAAAGLALSLLFVRETRGHAALEARDGWPAARDALPGARDVLPDARAATRAGARADIGARQVFALGSWRDPALSGASHAGMVNNLNDGLAWGLFPLFFASAGLDLAAIGVLSFIYPAAWGVLQLWTGALSDVWGRKGLIVVGMLVQGVALSAIALSRGFWAWAASGVLLGAGTAMVYPTLLAVVGDVAHPRWRGSAVGVYRLWRDSGYVVGALVAGVLADAAGMPLAIGFVALLTFVSGGLVAVRMPETLRRPMR